MTTTDVARSSHQRSGYLAAAILGFAFGGFFDGILLHQVLQWHHFLSLVQDQSYQDLRVQVLADGLFHVAVYIVAAIGLALLWRRGHERPSDRMLLAWAVLGFSIWQFSDVVLIHWIVGIHRIRVGVPNPLMWDIGWLVVFGVSTLLIGLWLLSRARMSDARRPATSALLSLCIVVSGAVATVPSNANAVVVMFGPSFQPTETFAAAASVDASVLWSDATGRVLVLEVPPTSSAWTLYGKGALLVGSTAAFGCLRWSPT
jgi:uncharacterized membrane protein